MISASLKEIKSELQELDPVKLHEICLRLARYKKENKELLTYLLFEANDEQGYIEHVKTDVDLLFEGLPGGNVYYVKKGLRKVLRHVNRQVKYSGLPKTELEIRIYFCLKIVDAKVPLRSNMVLTNLYRQQINKINSILNKLPEDLRSDYEREINSIMQAI